MLRHARSFALVAAAVLISLGSAFPRTASAQLPYYTWYSDLNAGYMETQPIYVPDRVVGGDAIGTPLSSPSDVFVAGNDHVYVADTGNNRIVELDDRGRFVRAIGESEGDGALNQPEGVFVTADGTIYAANTGGQSIVVYDAGGRFVRSIGKPESNLLPDDYHFLPTKLVVDRRGVLYVTVKDTFLGLLRMNPEGQFTGFFGANKAKLTWLDRFKRSILNEQQLSREIAKQPNAIANVTLSPDGFLVTTSSGRASDGQIKKLNAGGFDAFGDRAFREETLVDTAIDANGFLYGLNRADFTSISVYDPTGENMFYFGATESNARQLGVADFPVSIDINSRSELWVADNASGLIHVFKRTAFGDTFMTASNLYFEGDYEGSRSYWEDVIRQNGMLNIAYDGLAKIALHDKNYRLALDYFELSGNSDGYSDAYWYIRYEWLKEHFLLLVASLAVGIWALLFGSRRAAAYVRKREWSLRTRRYGSDIRDAFYVMAHPYNGFYRLKERRVSLVVVFGILLLALGVHLWSIFASGFIAYPYELGTYNIPMSLVFLVVPWVTWVVANYLVSTVRGGEGRFREVLQASAFAVMPYIVLSVPAALLSNIVVLEEWVVIDLIRQLMWIWVVVLLFVSTQVIHNFDFTETIKNSGITLFTIGVIWVFAMIISGLGYNFYDFVIQMYREVTFNG